MERLTLHEDGNATMEHMKIAEVDGGHMMYDRCIVATDAGPRFAKTWAPTPGCDAERADHSRLYLAKEAAVYQALRAADYQHVPDCRYDEASHTLLLTALRPEDGWQWRAPKEHVAEYVAAVFAALDELPEIAADHPAIRPSHHTLLTEGWAGLAERREIIAQQLTALSHPAAATLREVISADRYITARLQALEPRRLAHHDCRQSNIAWHPEHGVRLVDWSWASAGLPDADHTALLIDLHKYGHDVSDYLARFNPDHALLLIGFWLTHSTYPAGPDPRVRQQQLASSLAACELLERTSSAVATLRRLPDSKGNFWHDGPNYTADAIVITAEATPRILLIQRQDTGQWAVPGGFMEANEDGVTAAQRELREETGLTAHLSSPRVVYQGPVDDPRSTRQAWPETTAVLWRVAASFAVQGADDAINAQWLPLTDVDGLDFYGSHRWLIQRALAMERGDEPPAPSVCHAIPAAQSPTKSVPKSPQSRT